MNNFNSREVLEDSLKVAYKEGRVKDQNRFTYWLQVLHNVSRDDIDFLITEEKI